MHAFPLVATVLLLPAVATAQEPPTERELVADAVADAKAQLAANDLATVAHGAHAVATQRLVDAVPAVKARLAALADRPLAEREWAQLALLDALVQNDAKLTPRELAPFHGGLSATPAFVLACRDAAAHRAWLREHFRRLAAGNDLFEWLACGNVLADLHDADFAAQLLHGFGVAVTVTVHPPGAEPPFPGAFDSDAWHSTIRCFGGRRVPDGYPPAASYRLGPAYDTVTPLLAAGPRAVFLHRRERVRDVDPNPDGDLRTDDDDRDARHAWLARMLEVEPFELPLAVEQELLVPWTGLAALQRAADRQRDEIAAGFRQLVARCIDAELTTRSAVETASPHIELHTIDLRSDRPEPLPDLTPTPTSR